MMDIPKQRSDKKQEAENILGKTGDLKKRIASLNDQLKAGERELQRLYASCQHKWGEVQYKPIETAGYTIPGDPPGTMGVDWRGDCYVPAKTEKRWTRTCSLCGKTEETMHTRKETQAGRIAGTSSEVEVPHFPSDTNTGYGFRY